MFLLFSIIFSILEWFGEYKNTRWLIYLSKPLVIIFLFLWIITATDLNTAIQISGDVSIIGFLFALVFCLVGDIFLIFPERFFVQGLISFLVAHVFFIVGFGRLLPKERDVIPGLFLFVMLISVTFLVYKKLSLGIERIGKSQMKIPVAIYSIILTLMVYAAFLTLFNYSWDFQASFLVCLGAIAFFLSDILYAWTYFVEKLQGGRLKVMITYHLAIILLASGVIFYFLNLPT